MSLLHKGMHMHQCLIASIKAENSVSVVLIQVW